jgi:catechol 2,3-dioxygenase-like lactoylglutathione lyase family enzyme
VLTGIDHLVIVVPDLDTATAGYRDLGFTVVPGGRHPIGTHNALIAFADGAYLELIAFYEPSPRHRWWPPLQAGGGLVDFCLQTDDLPGDTAALRRAGVDIEDPRPLTRVRPDGYQLRWLLSIPRGGHRGVAPFLIQDETERAERVPAETRHANGVRGIGTVTVATRDVEAVRGWYAGVTGHRGADIRRDEVAAAGARVTIGRHTFDLVAPTGTASPVSDWIRERGSSPYAATLMGGRPGGPLDGRKTLGARLSVDPA